MSNKNMIFKYNGVRNLTVRFNDVASPTQVSAQSITADDFVTYSPDGKTNDGQTYSLGENSFETPTTNGEKTGIILKN